jgi:hypothetical protein
MNQLGLNKRYLIVRLTRIGLQIILLVSLVSTGMVWSTLEMDSFVRIVTSMLVYFAYRMVSRLIFNLWTTEKAYKLELDMQRATDRP